MFKFFKKKPKTEDYLLRNKGNPNEMIGDKTIYFKTKGYHDAFLRFNKFSTIGETQKFYDSMAKENSDSFNTIVGYEDGRINIMFECSKEKLTSRILDALISRKIVFGCNDFIVTEYNEYDDHTEEFRRSLAYYKYNYIVKNKTLVDCFDISISDDPEYVSSSINALLPNDIVKIDENAFHNFKGVNLEVKKTIKEFIGMYSRLSKKENMFGYVRCSDGCMMITNISHKKTNVPLYYSGIHMCMMEPKQALQHAKDKKYFAYLKCVPGFFIRTHGKIFFSDHAIPYEDYENMDEEYSTLDFDNFNHLSVFDFQVA